MASTGAGEAPPEPSARPAAAVLDAAAASRREEVARKREALRRNLEKRRAADDASTERWSGLRIVDRCVRQEKWDASMRGKQLVPFYKVGVPPPAGQDSVLIGVLCARPGAPGRDARGERCAELLLTDLAAGEPRQASLVLYAGALDHWAADAGAGFRHATVGSILAVLNPSPAVRGRGVRVSFETQVVKLGTCPSLAFCPALGADGLPCGLPHSSEGGQGYCGFHSKVSPHARQAQRSAPGRAPGAAGRPGARGGAAAAAEAARPSKARRTASPARGAAPRAGAPPSECAAGAGGGAAAVAASESVADAAERAALALCAGPRHGGCEGALAVLRQLEAVEPSRELLRRHPALYDRLGELARSAADAAAGAAARSLWRRWRVALLGG